MTWIEALPAFVVALAILYVPGVLVGAVAGVRGIKLYASAPAITVALLAVLAIVLPWVHVDWSPVWVFISVLIVILVVAVVRALVSRRFWRVRGRPDSTEGVDRRLIWMLVAAIGIPAIAIVVQTTIAFVSPDSISQTFDAIFHLNALRFIEDTGNASSFHIDQLVVPPGTRTFYPAAWHSLTSLVIETTGVSIPVGANITNVAIAAFAWPAGLMLLARTLLPGSRVAIVAAGVLAAAVPGFPLLMVSFGVLYPYFLALAFLPIALALGAKVLLHAFHGEWKSAATDLWLVLVILIAIGLAQPAVVFAWAALLVPLVVVLVVGLVRTLRRPVSKVLVWAILAVAVLVFVIVWIYEGRLGSTTPWVNYTSPQAALWEAVTYSKSGTPLALAVGILTLLGLIRLVMRPGARWYLGSWAIGLFLFGVAASLPSWKLRWMITGLFYRDPPRLYALFTVVSIPVAIIGAVWLWQLATSSMSSQRQPGTDAGATAENAGRGSSATLSATLGVIAIVVLVAATQGSPAVWHQVNATRATYTAGAKAPVLSDDERTLIERLPREVPSTVLIAGDPWTGTAYAYALVNRPVLNPHFSARISPYAGVINAGLNQAKSNPAVCQAVRTLHVEYVLDFGTFAKDAGKTGFGFNFTAGYTGLGGLVRAGVATEVDHEGSARLLKITACS
ncbi:DUF6541 family protein [Humibacter sp. RRB41]|uniref:DUF6541 family protein n=1 Tax=Humibacter sp. RRB41 TaxID=2919946 RepID=UPI001FA9711E|nr:DUF6541 family protein [Humibacter sp. RRB41]